MRKIVCDSVWEALIDFQPLAARIMTLSWRHHWWRFCQWVPKKPHSLVHQKWQLFDKTFETKIKEKKSFFLLYLFFIFFTWTPISLKLFLLCLKNWCTCESTSFCNSNTVFDQSWVSQRFPTISFLFMSNSSSFNLRSSVTSVIFSASSDIFQVTLTSTQSNWPVYKPNYSIFAFNSLIREFCK